MSESNKVEKYFVQMASGKIPQKNSYIINQKGRGKTSKKSWTIHQTGKGREFNIISPVQQGIEQAKSELSMRKGIKRKRTGGDDSVAKRRRKRKSSKKKKKKKPKKKSRKRKYKKKKKKKTKKNQLFS